MSRRPLIYGFIVDSYGSQEWYGGKDVRMSVAVRNGEQYAIEVTIRRVPKKRKPKCK